MRRIVSLLFILALLVGCAPSDQYPEGTVPPEEIVTPEPEPEPEPITATLTVAGDIMSHMPITRAAYVAETDSYDYAPILRYAKPWVEQADLALGNLETTFSGGPDYSGFPAFNTPDALGYALKDAGFDLLSTTNNHSLDRGYSGLVRTLDTLDEIGLPHVGTYRTQEERDANHGIVVADCGGISIAFLAYSYGTNGIPVPGDKPYCINLFNTDYATTMSTPNTALLEADMAAARALDCDLIAVVMHWGIEYNMTQNSYQEAMAQTLVDLGADLVLGGHPHVLQPYEFLTTEAGNSGFVCYSLGNFISNQDFDDTNSTVLLNLELKKDPVTGQTTVEDVNYVPFFMVNPGRNLLRNPSILLDVYASKAQHEGGDKSLVTDKIYQQLLHTLEVCHTVLNVEDDIQVMAQQPLPQTPSTDPAQETAGG